MAKGLRWTIVLTVALAALGAAGCGGGDTQELSREEFEQELADARTRVEDSLGGLSASDVGDPGGLAEGLDQAASGLRDVADDLGAQNVPDEAQDATERLVDNLRAFAGELEEVAAAVEDGGLQDILDAAQELQDSEAARRVQEALDDLREAGFDVGE